MTPAKREEFFDQFRVVAPALMDGDLDDLAVAVAQQSAAVLLGSHLPSEVLGEQFGEDGEEDGLVI